MEKPVLVLSAPCCEKHREFYQTAETTLVGHIMYG